MQKTSVLPFVLAVGAAYFSGCSPTNDAAPPYPPSGYGGDGSGVGGDAAGVSGSGGGTAVGVTGGTMGMTGGGTGVTGGGTGVTGGGTGVTGGGTGVTGGGTGVTGGSTGVTGGGSGVTGGTAGGTATGGTAGGTATGGTAGGTATGGSGADASGGSSGSATGGTAGTVEDVIDCSAVSGTGLPINETGWLDASCNSIGMQGAWFCFDDEIQDSTCVDGEPPFRAGVGMCVDGTSVEDSTYASWGAGIGLSLNETGGDDSVKTTYNATANGVVGYRVTLEGDSLGQSMRIGFSTMLDPGDNLTPFVEVGELVPGTPLTVEVIIEDCVVPEAWEDVPNAGEYADPSAIFDLQIQFPGGDVAGSYSFCITSLEPLTTGDIPVVDCSLAGLSAVGTISDQYGQLNVGNYMIQNNVWNSAALGHQAITAYQQSGGVAFVVNADSGYDVLDDPNLRPGGYGSAVYGWHMDGAFHGGYTSARAISSIGSIPTHWEHCTPAAGNWNAAYDIWLAPGGGSPSGDTGTELMIWTAYRDATPIGTEQGTVSLAGASWEVWVGEDAGAWQTISFRRITNTHVFDTDIKAFLEAGASYADYDTSHSLYGVQAGFEIWSTTNQNLGFTTATYSVSVQ
jgi:hypothetical protein